MPLRTTTAQTASTAATRQAMMKLGMGHSPNSLGSFYNNYELAATAIKRSKVALLRRDTFGLGGVRGRVDVKEGVDGRRRPVADGDAVARGPALDLVHVLLDQRLAQVLPQRHRPQADHGMPPIARARACKRHAGPLPRGRQARHQIARQERTIARHARDVGNRRCVRGRPIEPGEDAGERAGKTRHCVRYHRQTGVGEARRIAVGVKDDRSALRLEPCEHALEDGLAADADARFVAAAHPPRQPAGEHEPENWATGHDYDRAGRALVGFWIALLSIWPTFAASAIATNPSRCVMA